MYAKTLLRKKAEELRRNGYSYSEIRENILVSKSSLSLWLGSIKIDNSQKSRIRQKLIEAQKLGALAKKKQREEKVQRIKLDAMSEIKDISNWSLFLMGLMLYWAEGTKQTGKNISERVSFSNSDPQMCKVFVLWLKECLEIDGDRIISCIYIHETHRWRKEAVLDFWAEQISINKEKFTGVYFTNTKLSLDRRREDNGKYYGQCRIVVKKSTDLNRRISGWIEGVCFRLQS